ncbi:AbrB family transcriptional regulator [Roseomonas sp. BN140053]|uniref:AbrB family transcriptional regulator n=1 Tax=Roseomonas sp. BN140053 TaxID=3391898 RepID=UPI0039E78964
MRNLVEASQALLLTLALGSAGGFLLESLGMPAGWLCGSVLAVALGAFRRWPVRVPDPVRDGTFAVLGTSMGSALTPDTINDIRLWPLSIALLLLSVAATMAAVAWYLRRVHGWDAATARLAAVPGALSAVLALATSTTAQFPVVALSQTLRQLLLVSLMPLALAFDHRGAPLSTASPASLPDMALMLAAGLAGSLLLARLRVPGGRLVGAMLASGALHLGGWVSGRLDPAVLTAAFVLTGAVIGSRFAGARPGLLLATIKPATIGTAIAVTISLGFALLCQRLLGLPLPEIWLAYAPGGVEAMTVMAFALNLDPSYVSAHHVLRLLAITLLSPLWTWSIAAHRVAAPAPPEAAPPSPSERP